jgi:hypothetical protein
VGVGPWWNLDSNWYSKLHLIPFFQFQSVAYSKNIYSNTSLSLSLSPASRVPSRFQVSWFIHATKNASKPSNSTYISHIHTNQMYPNVPRNDQLSPYRTTYIHFIQSAKRNKNDLMIYQFSSFIIVQQKQSFIERAKLLWDENCTFTWWVGNTSVLQPSKSLYTKCKWLKLKERNWLCY